MRRMTLSSGLGLALITAGVALGTLTRVPFWWALLGVGTVAFGMGLALVPRVRRLKTELVWIERRAHSLGHDLRARQCPVSEVR